MKRSSVFKPTATTHKKNQVLSLHALLTRLIWLCVFPLVLLAIYLAVNQVQTLRAQADEEATNQVQNIAATIDRQLQAQIAALQVLAASPLVDDPPRLNEFYNESKAFRQNFGGHVILADPSMQMLFFTGEAFGAPLPKLPLSTGFAAAPAVLESGKPAVGDMLVGRVSKKPIVAVTVPVIRDGKTKFLLLSINETKQFQQSLLQVSIPAGWSLTLHDGKNEVIARRSLPDMADRADDEEPSERFVAHSAVSRWSVDLKVPRGVHRSHIMAASVSLAVAILAATLISVVAGRMASRRLTRSVAKLAEAPLHGTSHPSIEEIEAVGRKLVDAAVARETAEAKLVESERRYRDLYEHAPDMYVSVDAATGHIIQCNQTLLQVTGYSKEEIIGRLVFGLYHPDSIEDAQKVFQDFRSTGEVHNAELPLCCKDGSKVDVMLNTSAVYDESGKIAYSISSLRDITDRKKAEESLRENEERLNHALEVGQLGSWSLNIKTGKAWRSLRHDQIFGYQELLPEWTYQMFLDHVLPEHVNTVDERFDETLRTGTEWSFQCRIRRADGALRWIWAQGRPRFGDQGDLIELVGLVQDITDRKQAEEALKESEERRRLALDAAKAGTWDWDLRTNENFWSEELWGLYGLEPYSCEPSYEAWLQTIHPDDRADAEQAVNEAASKGLELNVEWRTNVGVGGPRWLMSRGRPLRDATNQMLRYIGTVMDISERKAAEEALREREQFLSAIVENIPHMIFVKEAKELRFVRFNKAGEEFVGHSREDMIGKNDYDFFPKEEAESFTAKDREILEQGVLKDIPEETIQTKHKGIRILHTKKIPMYGEHGTPQYVLGISEDITERKMTEQTLRKSEQFLRQTEQIALVGGWMANPQTNALHWTDGVRRIMEVPLDYQPGLEEGLKFYKSQYIPSIKKMVNDTLEFGTPHRMETEVVTASGKHLWTELRSLVRVDESGGSLVLGTFQDITERKTLEQQFLQAQKMEAVGTLAGGVAHDFNNVLQVALGYSELILGDEELPQRYRTDLQKIRESAQRGADLVQRLLTFSRKTEIKPRPLSLNHRITELQKMLERTLPKMIDIQLFLDGKLSKINADRTQIDQVLMNLAVNARDAMPDGGKLIFETANVILDEEYARTHLDAQPGAYVRLTVTDTGAGMDKGCLEHIFEPFYTTKAVGEGTGLGLAMVHGIVKHHGGHIRCYSEPGEGTVFKIYFPPLIAGEEKEETTVREMPRGGTETVLLVDDEEFIRDLGSRILAKAGYEVIIASSGKEALEIFQSRTDEIALVVLDLMMPEMGGKQCLAEILRIDPTAKVVIASGFSANGPTKDALAAGAKGFVNKPYDMRQMMEVVRAVLDEK
jgi:PAS domain S-box-containing protein